MTAALLDFDPATGQGRFLSAGHVDNLLHEAGGTWRSLRSTGLPLGLLPDGAPYTETELVIGRGEQVLLYSDGVTEAQDGGGEEFGEERLQAVVRDAAGQSADVLADRIVAAIDAFAGDAPQFDDITLLVVRRL